MKNRTSIKQLISKLFPYIKPHKTVFFISILFSMFAIVCNMLIPLFSGYALDTMLEMNNVNFAELSKYLIIIAILAVGSSFFDWFGSFYANILTFKTGQSLRDAIYNKLNNVPVKFIDNKPHGDLMNTMVADVENLTDGLLNGFKSIVNGIFQILIVIVFMFLLNWILALIVIFVSPFSLILAITITKRSKKLYKKRVELQGDISGYTEEMIANMKVLKAYNSESKSNENFDILNKNLYKASEKSVYYASLANPTSRLVNGILNGVVCVVGAVMAVNLLLSPGKILSFLNYSENYTKPFNDLTSIFADLNIAVASSKRVFDLLDETNEISDLNSPPLKTCNGEVSLKEVSFSYDPSISLIENFNLEVKKGQRIAIVGPTGCGKSTLINLLMRFYDVDKGCIKLSGKDIRKVTRKSFREYYGMVLQESWLYNATIRDNVAYGKPDATMDEVIEACRLANAHSFIERLPDGYNTIISERADNISAGQKQLLCIARVILKQPPLLILDEATSNVDTRTELKIQKAIDEVMKGKTCFIVAHRLSTIVNADVILVMKDGKIIEQGKHEELLKKEGFYYEIFNSQFST